MYNGGGGFDDENPFADMESSRVVYPTPPSPFEEAPEPASPFTPTAPQYDAFQRESAPEPETPFGFTDDVSYATPTPFEARPELSSPSAPYQPAPQTKAEIAALLGDPTPILPHFRASFKGSIASGGQQLAPVRDIGSRAGGGALATLLGFEAEPPSSPPAATTAPVAKAAAAPAEEPSKLHPPLPSETPLPPSAPITPLPSSPILPHDATSSTPATPASPVSFPAVADSMEISVLELDKSHDVVETTGVTEQLQNLTVEVAQTKAVPELSHPDTHESPFGPNATSVYAADIPSMSAGLERDSLFGDDGASAGRGFRSYNFDDDPSEGFPEPSGEREETRSMFKEREPSMRTIGLDSDRGSILSGITMGPTSNSPPLPSAPFEPLGSVEVTPALAPVFVISVGDPQKVGSTLNVAAQHTVYTVRTRTTSAAFRKPEFSVLRRFSHFLWLFDALTLNNPGVIVPGMPEKSAIGRFGSNFVENRRSALQAALMKIVSHLMLVGDADLRLFLESDNFSNDIKQRKVDAPVEGTGFFASIGSSITGPKFVETDEYFDTRRHVLDAFELQLKALLLSLSNSAKLRHSLQTSLGELQSALLSLSQCDLSTSLKSILEQAAAVQRKLRELSEAQSSAEEQIGGLTSVAEGYSRLCASVKLVFSSRIKSFHTWQTAESQLRKARAAHEKAKKSSRHTELLGQSLAEISDAERKAMDAKQDFEDVGQLVKMEMARFDKEKVEDFKLAVEEYANGMVLRQRQVVLVWQEYCEMLSTAMGETEGPGAVVLTH